MRDSLLLLCLQCAVFFHSERLNREVEPRSYITYDGDTSLDSEFHDADEGYEVIYSTYCTDSTMVQVSGSRHIFMFNQIPSTVGSMIVGNCRLDVALTCAIKADYAWFDKPRVLVEVRQDCGSGDARTSTTFHKLHVEDDSNFASANIELPAGSVFFGNEHIAGLAGVKLPTQTGTSITVSRVPPSMAESERALQQALKELQEAREKLNQCHADLEERGKNNKLEEIKVAFNLQKKSEIEKERDALLASAEFKTLRVEVRSMRKEVVRLSSDVVRLEAERAGASVAKLNQQIESLTEYLFHWEHGVAVPEAAMNATNGRKVEDAETRPEEAQWPPVLKLIHNKGSALSETVAEETRQIQNQVLQMQTILVNLQDAKKELATQQASLQSQKANLEAAKAQVSGNVKNAQRRLAKLKLAIKNGFHERWFRIRQLELLSARGAEVTTLLEQLLANLNDPAKRKRFDEFNERGLVDKAKLDNDKQVLDAISVQLKAKSYAHIWSLSANAVMKEKEQWQVAFDLSASCPPAAKPFTIVEDAIGQEGRSLFTAWLTRRPLAFSESLLEEYLNWVEDTNGAVRVYIKVTNRERTTESRSASNSLLACANPVQAGSLYVPDRKVRMFACDAKPPSDLLCDDVTGGLAPAESLRTVTSYGPYYGIFASSDRPQNLDLTQTPSNTVTLGSDSTWAPGLKSVLNQVKLGYTIVLFGYGYSGAGKTYTLLGDGDKAPGVVTIGLRELGSSLKSVTVRFKELYGKMKLEDGRPYSGETGIYSYELKSSKGRLATVPCPGGKGSEYDSLACLPTTFWGRHPKNGTKPSEGVDLSPSDFVNFMEADKLSVAGKDIGTFLASTLDLIKNTRMSARCRTSNEACPRLRATPNNPESSRGHLFTILDVEVENGKHGTIVVVDMAGAENPLAIAKDYVDYSVTGMSQQQIDAYVGKWLKSFDKMHNSRFKLWQSVSRDHKEINRRNAEAFLGRAETEAIYKRKPREQGGDSEVLKQWAERYIRPKLIPMIQEGVFVNEGLNHLKQFLLARGGKIETLTDGVKIFPWEIDGDDEEYNPQTYIQPSKDVRLQTTKDLYFTKENPDRVALITSGACAVDWGNQCERLAVDGFLLSPHDRTLRHQTLSKKDLVNGEMSKIDPMLMLSMLNYFDHPEFFKPPYGKPDLGKLPTKFIMIAAVRREHPLEYSTAAAASAKLSDHAFKELKGNICRGTQATLKFTETLNPMASS
eukprot:TRINITY_DN73369_c0_g1_i1.p1 TRINITY_DN73369_c0_g1~~TRINITY_DN73369_c0_g1_i1.p1  ORF type:complete len:1227 (+),score=152.00 TRINITY_DN73369_c0_g1_i1:51-3731(+)